MVCKKANKVLNLTFAALSCSLSGLSFADNIERIELGQTKNALAKPWAGLGFTKVKTINNITYGFTRHKDSVGNFEKFTIDRSYDGGHTWQNTPKTVLTNDDIVAVGVQQGKDYTYNQFESIKWFECPGTGKWSIYAKRLNATASGQKDYVNGKQLFGATVTAADGEVDSVYDAVRQDFPYGSASGDLGNNVVGDKAYIISTGRDDHTIRFLELTNDCSDIVDANVAGATPAKTLQWFDDSGKAEAREAPSIFQHNGYYYMMTSGATGWRPNQQKYAWATEFLGDWSEMIAIGDRTAYHSQVFWVRGLNANDGSDNKTKLFNGTRNAQVWNGYDNRDVVTPMYFNTPEQVATNHYDYIDINHTTAEVTGGNYDHGTRLTVKRAYLQDYSDSVSALIDGNQSTAWFKGNESGRDIIMLDLGSEQLVKAVKVKQFDSFNSNKSGEVEQKVFRVKIEVGDGSTYQTVFEDIVPSISWLHALNTTDATGRFIKITRLETHNGGSNAVQKHFGFYELEVWGETAEQTKQVSDNFESAQEGASPAGWNIYTPNNISATVSHDQTNGNVLKVSDFNATQTAYIKKEFTAQSGSNVTASLDMKFDNIGGGEKLRLRNGNTVALEIVNSNLVNGLAIAKSKTEHIKIADISANTWYQLRLNINVDANTFDVFLADKLIWGGAQFQQAVTQIDTLFIGSGWSQTGFTAYFDNIELQGPIKPNEQQPSPTLIDDFDGDLSQWQLSKGTWQIQTDSNNKVLTKVESNGTGYASFGDAAWSDYTVSADVRRFGQSAGVLGRYVSANEYYQFSIKSDGSYLLNKNNKGNWSQLASGQFANQSSDYYKLAMSFSADKIFIFINGQLLTSVTDSSFAAGKVGFRSQNGSASFDNLLVEQP